MLKFISNVTMNKYLGRITLNNSVINQFLKIFFCPTDLFLIKIMYLKRINASARKSFHIVPVTRPTTSVKTFTI